MNGANKDSATEPGKLMHDFFCTDSDDMNYKELADKVMYYKEDGKGRIIVFGIFKVPLKVPSVKRSFIAFPKKIQYTLFGFLV